MCGSNRFEVNGKRKWSACIDLVFLSEAGEGEGGKERGKGKRGRLGGEGGEAGQSGSCIRQREGKGNQLQTEMRRVPKGMQLHKSTRNMDPHARTHAQLCL